MREAEPFRVATLNLLFDLTFWEERSHLVLAGFRQWRPHVIALQEVSPQVDNAHWLAAQLGDYEVHVCPALDHPSSDTLALLVRLPAREHETLTLGAEGRQAQRITVEHGGTIWTVANTHLYWNPVRESVRVEQARALLRWLDGPGPVVLCGDFNARPHARSQQVLSHRFLSAHRTLHGRDPDYTYPTPLRRGPGARHAARTAFFRAGGWVRLQHDAPWHQTVDHIFVDRAVDVRDCRVIFDLPASHDPSLFASDHLGLLAELVYQGLHTETAATGREPRNE